MKRMRDVEWEAIAGIVAAVAALVLDLLNKVDSETVLSVMLVILALILLRALRADSRGERAAESLAEVQAELKAIAPLLSPPDTVLIGPRELRSESERFAATARGEMNWYNMCLLMFAPQSLFDALLRPAIESPHVTSIRFVLSPREEERWNTLVAPKIAECKGKEKVVEPVFLEMEETLSFILAGKDGGKTEAHLSFWGEPFMARSAERSVPRYVFHVLDHSALIGHLVDLEREHRAPST